MRKALILLPMLVFTLIGCTQYNLSGWFFDGETLNASNTTIDVILGPTNLHIGNGYTSGGISLYGRGDNIGSGFYGGDIILDGSILSITDSNVTGDVICAIDGTCFLGNGSNRFKSGNFTGTVQAASFVGDGAALSNPPNSSLWALTNNEMHQTDTSRNVGIGTPTPTSKLHVIGNVNISNNLFINQSEIGVGNIATFTGLEKAMVFDNLLLHDKGSVAFAFIDEKDEKILLALQVGEPESGGFWRNSKIISEDYGIMNATQLTDCTLMQSMAGIPNRIHCNTTQYGASLYVEGNQQIGGHLYVGGSNKTTGDGLTVEGVAAFILNNTDLEVFGNIHPKTELIVEQGFSEGEQAQLLFNTFSDGNIDPFYKREQIGADANNWDAEITALYCEQGECANANGGDGSADRLMETNISTVNEGLVNISFYYGIENFDSGTVDNCSLIVYDGSNSYLLWNYTDAPGANTDVTATFIQRDFPDTLWQESKVSIQFGMHSNNANEICHIDTVKVLGNTTTATSINITTFNSRIYLGDGSQSIFWNDTSKVLELPSNATIISETIIDLIISGTLTLGSKSISSFDDIVAGFQNETTAWNWDNNASDILDNATVNRSVELDSYWDTGETATPSDGDTTHISTADQIYDYIVSLNHITNAVNDLVNYFTKADIFTHIENNITSNNESLNTFGWVRNNTPVKFTDINSTNSTSEGYNLEINNSVLLDWGQNQNKRIYANETCVVIQSGSNKFSIC